METGTQGQEKSGKSRKSRKKEVGSGCTKRIVQCCEERNTGLLSLIAKIRQAAKIPDSVMLYDLPDVIAKKMEFCRGCEAGNTVVILQEELAKFQLKGVPSE